MAPGVVRREVVGFPPAQSVRCVPMKRRDFLALSSAAAVAACVPPERRQAEGEGAAGSLEVEVWHDLICPWCRIGLHNLRAALADGKGPRVVVRMHPYLLNPDTPPEGRDLRAELDAKYGRGAGVADTMFARVSDAGARYGVRFAWDKVRVSPQTAPAHALLGALDAAKESAQLWRVVEALHVAYFEEGQNFGDLDVLAGIAARAGVDEQRARTLASDAERVRAVREQAARAPSLGIRGVPHFVIGDEVLRGAQPPSALRDALEKLAAKQRAPA